MKHLVGVVSYGGLPFLELFLRSVQENCTKSNVDLVVIVAKPDDFEMVEFLLVRGIRFIQNERNIGFAGSINDLLDAAFVDGDYDTLTICGNDTVLMPGSLDAMIEHAESSPWEMLCGSEFDSRFLVANYPEIRHLFHGPNLEFRDFTQRPWEIHKDYRENTIEPNTLKDVRNFTMFKRSVFEKVGYAEVSYYPGAYYEDLSYARRCHLSGIKAAGLPRACFYHAWSRTIHQGVNRDHGKFYERNAAHYEACWGTRTWGQERFALPFDGQPYRLPGSDIILPPTLEIGDRDLEARIVQYWSSLP